VLADFCFQRSNLVLTATAQVPGSVTVGSVTHRLENPVSAVDVHFPGEFVHRVDGVSPSGSGQPECLDRLGVDGDRTARLRMERNAVMAFDLQGTSGCSHLTPGYRFTLTKHHDGDGDYLVARVRHLLTSSDLRGGSPNEWSYENQFSALPASLPYRPPRSTPKARVRGTQTAIVVGSGNDPIRTDRYGRVKVRFHWDVRGVDNADSSAWVRVAQSWAGNRWGMLNIPRAGQEVVVDFLDSDPDCPIIIGSVYNEKNPPPFDLPSQKTLSGFKSDSQLSDEPDAFSGLAVEDRDGSEELHLRSQKDMIVNVKNNHLTSIHGQNVEHTGSVRLTTLGGFAPPGIGSGSGGGESGNKFEDAAGWGYGMVKDHLGQSYATTIGIEAQKGIGQNTIAIYGGEQSLVVDPLAWINEFTCVPVNPKLAMAVGVAMGTGRQTVTYGKLVDMSYGARMQVARGPYYAYAGPMTSGAKFPSRTFVGLRPLPTVLAFVAEALVTEFKGKNVDVIVGLNAGALVTQGLLGWWCGKADRVYLRTLESTLKLADGLSTTLSGYSDAPIRDTSETYALVRRIMATHISEAREDLTFQAGVTEDRAAHRQLIEGPYSVKASGAIEIATFDGVESGQARFNLQEDSALLAGSRVCSLMSGKSVLQLSPEGVHAFAGPNGTIKLCAGFRPDRIDSRTQVQIGPSNLSLAVGATPLPTRIGMIPGEIRLATGAATASRIIMDDDHVELKFGASSIRLDATGITLTGNLIRLDGQSGIQHRSPLTQIQ
jgi:phage baseplate assembly protein gpV